MVAMRRLLPLTPNISVNRTLTRYAGSRRLPRALERMRYERRYSDR